MSSISYEKIYGSFLSNITDYKIATQDEDVTTEQLADYLHKAVGTPYIRALFISIELDDDNAVLNYEIKNPDVNGDDDFMIHMFGKAMVYEWVLPQVNKTSLLAQMFSGKEVKWYSNANHMAELRGIKEDTELEVRRMIRDRGFISNEYLKGGTT